jgi:hypothetical protein
MIYVVFQTFKLMSAGISHLKKLKFSLIVEEEFCMYFLLKNFSQL